MGLFLKSTQDPEDISLYPNDVTAIHGLLSREQNLAVHSGWEV